MFPKKIYTSIYGKSIELLPYNRKILLHLMFMFLVFVLASTFSVIYFPLVNTTLGPNYVLLSIVLGFALFVRNLLKSKIRIDPRKEIIVTSREQLDIWRKVGLPENIANIMEMPINQADDYLKENRNAGIGISLDVFKNAELMLAKIGKIIFPTKHFS